MTDLTETIDAQDATGTREAESSPPAEMTGERSLRIERSFQATPEEVFDAWTDPEVLRRWWAVDPAGRTPVAEVDLRVGGRYRLSMEQPDGTRHTVAGEYLEVVRPERLVYSWAWEQDDGRLDEHASTVTVQFNGEGDQTKLVLEHTDLASSESRDRHADGWSACLGVFRSRGFSNRTS